MEVEAMALETRGLWLDEEGKAGQGYGRHFDEIGVSKRSGAMGEVAFEGSVPEKAVAGSGIVKAASWSDLPTYFAYHPDATWTAPLEKIAAGNKAAQAEVFKAGNKAAQAEVFKAGNKAAQVKEMEEAKSAAAVKKTKKMLVQVSEERIKILQANPPDPTFSQRMRAWAEDSDAFADFDPEIRQAILGQLPQCVDLVDKWNETRRDILHQYNEDGSAYEEIEVDEEIEAYEGN